MNDTTFTTNDHEVRVLDGPYVKNGAPTSEAKQFANALIDRLDEMRVFASKRYLKIYNETWREEDSPVVDEKEFCDRLINPSIVLYDEIGFAVIYFDDSDMFAGHSIEVSVDDGEIVHASMVG